MTDARAVKLVAGVFLAGGVIWFTYSVRGILAPFVISAVFAYVLSTWVGHLEARGIRRSVAVTLLFLFFTVAFVGGIALAVPTVVREVSSFSTKLPDYVESMKAATARLTRDVERSYPVIRDQRVIEKLTDKARQAAEGAAADLPAYLGNLAGALSLAALVPFITFFFLVESRPAIAWLFERIPARHTETALSLLCEIDETLGSYIHGQCVESACVGALSAIGLWIIGVDYALLIGGVAGLANLIPYLGPFIGSVPAIVIGFVKFQSFDIVLKVVAVFAAVQFLDNNVIQPAILSRGVNIHPLVVIFAVMAGAEVGGVLGMFLAVPVACILKIVVQVAARRLRWSWARPAMGGAVAALSRKSPI